MMEEEVGRSPLRGSGHSPNGGAAKASPAEPSVPNAAHTPLPWGISYGFNLSLGRAPATYVAGPNPDSVGIKLATPWVEGAWDNDPEADANVAFIVRACNAHYALVEALEIIWREWSIRCDPNADFPDWPDDAMAVMNDAFKNEFAAKARDALAKARGEHDRD